MRDGVNIADYFESEVVLVGVVRKVIAPDKCGCVK